ncbi:hypothetical protein NDU88_007100 [Pleurodeles waltl]|uniref:Reverse transcriptase domain-containing protein n=1 Tax=Pleurodeles waltl TaxID=8319 RepID=A0AAV7NS50_PLEWA|nr:hypothetical protein NDU88_007100 [Pleurodeles waltl]
MNDRKSTSPAPGVLAVDIEKAFDSLEWAFLYTVMSRLRFGPEYIAWVRLLYTEPTARVRTGRIISRPYVVERGTRQGCPLSPLLFALAMEPLAAAARGGGGGPGIVAGGKRHQIALYADDLLIFLDDVHRDLPPTQHLLSQFGELSGLRVNWGKTGLFPLNATVAPPLELGNVQWVPRCLSYLGVKIFHDPQDIIDSNIGGSLRSLRSNMAFWQTLPLSVAGRVAILKMVVLPRLLYHFTVLPVRIPNPIFAELESIIIAFIWGSGRK